MGLKTWFNSNVLDVVHVTVIKKVQTANGLLVNQVVSRKGGPSYYGDVVPNVSKPTLPPLGVRSGAYKKISKAKTKHLAKSAFNLTYMSGKEKREGKATRQQRFQHFLGYLQPMRRMFVMY